MEDIIQHDPNQKIVNNGFKNGFPTIPVIASFDKSILSMEIMEKASLSCIDKL